MACSSADAGDVEFDHCNGCLLNTFSFVRIVSNEEDLRLFLIKHGVLSEYCYCDNCGAVIKANWKRKTFRHCKSALICKKKEV